MATATAQVGTYSRLRMEANVVGTSAAGRWSDVSVQLYFEETSGSNNLAWNAGGISASVALNGGGIWSGSFGFDWRPGGLQSVLLYSATTRITHNADGTPPSVTFSGSNGATGSSGGGGGGSVSLGVSLSTLKVVPGVPTGVTATRVSDTQTTVAWSQSSASNGQPTTNTIQQSIDGGAWTDLVTINAASSAVVATAANRKVQYRVRGNNTAGSSAYSGASSAIYTTPAAPSSVVATKQANLDIVVTFAENVGYAEYNHEVWHGVVAGGVTTWDGAALATLASGVLSYTHAAPNAAQVHVYRVRSKSGSLLSAYVESNSVQLLVAPNKPTLGTIPAFADKAAALTVPWVHNSVDTTPQSAYEVNFSTNGGTSWTTTGKVASSTASRVIAANTYAANAAVSIRVRTWGAATTGGAEGTGASAWSDVKTVTYKTVPTASITTPANGSTVNDGTLRVTVGYTQPEGSAFVKASLELLEGSTLLETLDSTNLVGITMATLLENGTSYTVRARVQSSNGLWSTWVSSTFSVVYLTPVIPDVALSYLEENGYAQIDIGLPAPRTNLAVNPSYETAGASVVVRTNYATNPCIGGSLVGLSGGRTTLSDGGSYIRATITDALVSSVAQLLSGNTTTAHMMPIAAGETLTVQAEGRASSYPNLCIVVQFFDATPTYLAGSQVVGASTPVQSSDFTPLAPLTVVAPAGSVYARWFVALPGTDPRAVNDTFDVRNVMFEKTTVALPFFSGETVDTADLTYSWASTVGSSVSTQNALSVASKLSVGVIRHQSIEHVLSGARSSRLFAPADIASNSALLYPISNFIGVAGQVYTWYLSVWRDANAPALFVQNGVGSLPQSPLTTKRGEWERLSVTFIANGGAELLRLRNQGIMPAGSAIWVDDEMLVAEPNYSGPWFSGAQSEAATITVSRTIDGVKETVVENYPAAAELTFLDTTPIINGSNVYDITATSALGATRTVHEELVTNECRRAFLSKGAGYSDVVVFGGNLEVDESLSVAGTTVKAAGRTKPIGLYGVETSVKLSVNSRIFEGFGSTVDELRKFILKPGKACYRDASGRRVFGQMEGGISYKKSDRADFSFDLTESS